MNDNDKRLLGFIIAGLAFTVIPAILMNFIYQGRTSEQLIFSFFGIGFIISAGYSLLLYCYAFPYKITKPKHTKIAHIITTNVCGVCFAPVSPSDRVCPRCGAELDDTGECSVCNAAVSRNDKICKNCGANFD